MKNKNQYNEKDVEKILLTLSEDRELMEVISTGESVYEAVMSFLNIDEKNKLYYNLIRGILRRQTKDHLVFSIWNNLSDDQAIHLQEYINEMAVLFPNMAHEDILMEFSMKYPTLMEKVSESLSNFFKEFISRFNGLAGA